MEDKNEKREKMNKISCSFCSVEIECPENMMHYEKHSCYNCYKKIGKEIPKENLGKIHVDVPKDEMVKTGEFLEAVIGKGFEQFMSQSKNELKMASKKEAMRESFMAGASFMLQFIDSSAKEHDEHDLSHEGHEHDDKEGHEGHAHSHEEHVHSHEGKEHKHSDKKEEE